MIKAVFWDWMDTIFDSKRSKIVPLALTKINHFAAQNKIQGIITNGNHIGIIETLKLANIIDYFKFNEEDLIISPYLGFEPKPSIQMFKALEYKTNLNAGSILYIGDTDIDYQMAIKAGCEFQFADKI